ncbi:MAG: helix-turn-helix transcriptional regulator [Methylotenera sp.]|uniref:helix-turn-helix domain-containing protein n=1 Tax=Methylotenera sp. TaxID=2051956 RepID=UPI002487B59D|nr:helix-turn-helix transcriptional regulator [Methylotenera sp.]MDI1308624.1 helix-turn-helix transcriptional regulator [Methylotenera sp.]
MSIFSKRLKEARLRKGISQEQLGLEAGLDAMSASARMNRYELAKRVPDFSLVERLAAVLEVQTAYLFTKDDDLANFILDFNILDDTQKNEVAALLKTFRKDNS